MKRCYFFILITVILAYSVSAEKPADIDVKQKECFDDGSLQFTAKNYGRTTLYLKDLQVNILDPNDKLIPLKGEWDKEYIKGDPCYDENPISYSSFTSIRGMANISGEYKLVLKYLKCEKTPCEDCEEIIPFERCPGYDYDCNIVDIQLECFNKAGAVNILFNSINKNQFTKIDPDKEVLFDLEGIDNNRNFYYRELSAEDFGRTVKDYNNDTYHLIVPMEQDRIIDKVTIKLKPCSQYPSIKFQRKCTYNEQEQVKITEAIEQEPPSLSPLITGNLAADIVDSSLESTEKTSNSQITTALLGLAIGFGLGILIKSRKRKIVIKKK